MTRTLPAEVLIPSDVTTTSGYSIPVEVCEHNLLWLTGDGIVRLTVPSVLNSTTLKAPH